jgi:hypothetical protein
MRWQVPGDEKVPQGRIFHGFKSTATERADVGKFGDIAHVGEVDGSVWVSVLDKDRIPGIAALDSVYSLQLPKKEVQNAITYSLTWKQEKEKISGWLWPHRDAWDGPGTGGMPDSVYFAIVDSGYDRTETRFFTENGGQGYAESQIYQCTRWVNSVKQVWTRTSPTQTLGAACGDATENNSHGTGIADIMDRQNKGTGRIYIYNRGTDSPMEWSYEDIQLNIPSIDVISTSTGVTAGNTNHCRGYFDNTLQDLVVNQNTMLSSSGQNPGTADAVYPLESTWFITTGGVQDGSPWPKPTNAVARFVLLSAADCPVQWIFHQARDGATQIWKPDVYGSYLHYVDVNGGLCFNNDPKIVCGTSWAQPDTASGLGTMVSRYFLGKDGTYPRMKTWDATKRCWGGAVKLAWASNSPDGRGITPWVAGNEKGRLQDHDAWWLDSFTC